MAMHLCLPLHQWLIMHWCMIAHWCIIMHWCMARNWLMDGYWCIERWVFGCEQKREQNAPSPATHHRQFSASTHRNALNLEKCEEFVAEILLSFSITLWQSKNIYEEFGEWNFIASKKSGHRLEGVWFICVDTLLAASASAKLSQCGSRQPRWRTAGREWRAWRHRYCCWWRCWHLSTLKVRKISKVRIKLLEKNSVVWF